MMAAPRSPQKSEHILKEEIKENPFSNRINATQLDTSDTNLSPIKH